MPSLEAASSSHPTVTSMLRRFFPCWTFFGHLWSSWSYDGNILSNPSHTTPLHHNWQLSREAEKRCSKLQRWQSWWIWKRCWKWGIWQRRWWSTWELPRLGLPGLLSDWTAATRGAVTAGWEKYLRHSTNSSAWPTSAHPIRPQRFIPARKILTHIWSAFVRLHINQKTKPRNWLQWQFAFQFELIWVERTFRWS